MCYGDASNRLALLGAGLRHGMIVARIHGPRLHLRRDMSGALVSFAPARLSIQCILSLEPIETLDAHNS